jgi:hypothetical protein
VDGRLQSVLYDDVWEPGRPLAARCEHGHSAPDPTCACGIYAANDPAEARRYLVGRDESGVVGRVLGRVFLWGLVVEGEHGWRAAFAYPAVLDPETALLYGAAKGGVDGENITCARTTRRDARRLGIGRTRAA